MILMGIKEYEINLTYFNTFVHAATMKFIIINIVWINGYFMIYSPGSGGGGGNRWEKEGMGGGGVNVPDLYLKCIVL